MGIRVPLEALKCPCCLSQLLPVRVAVESQIRCRRCGTKLDGLGLPEDLVEIV
jgi:hypothetical protein